MANELKIQLTESGLSLQARLVGSTGSLIQNNIALAENGSTGFYYGSVPGNPNSGIYTVVFYEGSIIYGVGELVWKDGAEVSDIALTEEEKQKITDLHALLMLDPNREVTHTSTSITVAAGSGEDEISISLNPNENANTTSGQRNV